MVLKVMMESLIELPHSRPSEMTGERLNIVLLAWTRMTPQALNQPLFQRPPRAQRTTPDVRQNCFNMHRKDADILATGAEVQCDEGSLDDIFNNPWEQWNDSGAAGAWNSMSAPIPISGST